MGIRGLIVPDLPPEEGGSYLRAAKEAGVAPVQIFAPTTTDERMTELALSFPTLSEKTPGVSPWDQDKLNEWAQSGGPSSGERATANGQLIEALVKIVREVGKEPATTAEARAMLGILQ